MKKHKRFEELIQGYVDNVLSDKERQDFENHLKSCKICEEKLKEREKLLEKLRSTREKIECPYYLIDNILKNTTRKETPTIISLPIIKWKYLAVGAAALFIVVFSVLFNTENQKQILTTKGFEKIQKKEDVEEVEISKSKEISLDKEKVEVTKAKESDIRLRSEELSVPKASLPEKKVDFATREKSSEATSSEGMPAFAEVEEMQEETPILSKAAKTPPSAIIKRDRSGESLTSELETGRETGKIPPALPGGVQAYKVISEEKFKETRFVFPEEGSVVGKDFEIVLVLENPEEVIEIRLDGETITNYIKEKDSNIIFIGSDSIPPL